MALNCVQDKSNDVIQNYNAAVQAAVNGLSLWFWLFSVKFQLNVNKNLWKMANVESISRFLEFGYFPYRLSEMLPKL